MQTDAELDEHSEAVAPAEREWARTSPMPSGRPGIGLPRIAVGWILAQVLFVVVQPAWILITASQVAVASMWVVVGRTPIWIRVAVYTTFITVMIGIRAAPIALMSLLIVGVILLAQVLGLRFYLRAPDDPVEPQRWQFRIWQLMAVTAVFAVLALSIKRATFDFSIPLFDFEVWLFDQTSFCLMLWWSISSLLMSLAAFRGRLGLAWLGSTALLLMFAWTSGALGYAVFAVIVASIYCGILLLHLAPTLADEIRLERW